MSKAIELDKLHGIDPDAAEQQAVVIVLEAFYHAARAEALREAAELSLKQKLNGYGSWDHNDLRAMADREGK